MIRLLHETRAHARRVAGIGGAVVEVQRPGRAALALAGARAREREAWLRAVQHGEPAGGREVASHATWGTRSRWLPASRSRQHACGIPVAVGADERDAMHRRWTDSIGPSADAAAGTGLHDSRQHLEQVSFQ